jgi:hypothetical protein
MSKIAAIYFGHSHLAFMIPYLYHRPLDEAKIGREVEHYVFDVYNNRGIFAQDETKLPYGISNSGTLFFNPDLLERARERIAPDRQIVYMSLFGGNSHNALTMLSPDREYDFIVPGAEDLPLDPDRELIPSGVVEAALQRNSQIYLDDLEGLANSAQAPVYHIISPPPIQDDETVASIVGNDPFFSGMDTKDTPAIIRYKAWLLHSQIFKRTCARTGATAIDPPPSAVCEDKWLSPDCIGSDPTHGNRRYGELVFNGIEKCLGGHFAGWDWIR